MHAVLVVERRSRLRRRPHEQPAAGLQARRHVREGGVRREEHAPGRKAPCYNFALLAGQGAAVPVRRRRSRTRRFASRPARRWRSWRTSAGTRGTTRASSSTPHSFAVDSKGNLFIGEVNDGQRYYRLRVQGHGPATVDAMTSTSSLVVGYRRSALGSASRTADDGVRAADDRSLRARVTSTVLRSRVSLHNSTCANGACRRNSSRSSFSDRIVPFVHGAGTPAGSGVDVPRIRTTAGWHSSRERLRRVLR